MHFWNNTLNTNSIISWKNVNKATLNILPLKPTSTTKCVLRVVTGTVQRAVCAEFETRLTLDTRLFSCSFAEGREFLCSHLKRA